MNEDVRDEYTDTVWTEPTTEQGGQQRRDQLVRTLEAAGIYPLYGRGNGQLYIRVKPEDRERAARLIAGERDRRVV